MKLKEVALGYTWVGIFNQLFFQWFFIRLCVMCKEDRTIIKWKFEGFIVPLTGWWSWAPNYVWVWKRLGKRWYSAN